MKNNKAKKQLMLDKRIKFLASQIELSRQLRDEYGKAETPVASDGRPSGQLLQRMPTGAGKTIFFLKQLADVSRWHVKNKGADGSVYYIAAPRISLVAQIANETRQLYNMPAEQVTEFYGTGKNNIKATHEAYDEFRRVHGKKIPYVVVGTIQSMGTLDFDHPLFKGIRGVVFDEIHEVIKDETKYDRRIALLDEFKRRRIMPLIINTSATMISKGMRDIQDEDVFGKLFSVSKKFCVDNKVITGLNVILMKCTGIGFSKESDSYYSSLRHVIDNEQLRVDAGAIKNQKCLVTVREAVKDHSKFLKDYLRGKWEKELPGVALAFTDCKHGCYFNGERVLSVIDWKRMVESHSHSPIIISHWGQLTMGFDIKSINSGVMFRGASEDNMEQLIGRGLRFAPNKDAFNFYFTNLAARDDKTMAESVALILRKYELGRDAVITFPLPSGKINIQAALNEMMRGWRKTDNAIEEVTFSTFSEDIRGMSASELKEYLRDIADALGDKSIEATILKSVLKEREAMEEHHLAVEAHSKATLKNKRETAAALEAASDKMLAAHAERLKVADAGTNAGKLKVRRFVPAVAAA